MKSTLRFIQKLRHDIESFLFPEICEACGDFCESLCLSCQHKIKIYPHRRDFHGLSIYAGTWYQKDSFLARLIHEWKYESKHSYFAYIAPLILEACKLMPACRDPVIIPIPMNKHRQKERGFNQAEALANILTPVLGGTLLFALEHCGDESHQAHKKNKQARLDQSLNRFRCRLTLDPNKEYIVVDDIITSGATLYAAFYSLWAAGARQVYGLCLADRPQDF